jgi:hypothetical protein
MQSVPSCDDVRMTFVLAKALALTRLMLGAVEVPTKTAEVSSSPTPLFIAKKKRVSQSVTEKLV